MTRDELQAENKRKEAIGLKAIERYCLANNIDFISCVGSDTDRLDGIDFYMNGRPYDLKVVSKQIWVDINRYDSVRNEWTSPIHNHPLVELVYLFDKKLYIIAKQKICDGLADVLQYAEVRRYTGDGNDHTNVDYTKFVKDNAQQIIPLTPINERNQEAG